MAQTKRALFQGENRQAKIQVRNKTTKSRKSTACHPRKRERGFPPLSRLYHMESGLFVVGFNRIFHEVPVYIGIDRNQRINLTGIKHALLLDFVVLAN